MHRWLVAVFALHFFLSVGALAFGKQPVDPSPHAMLAQAVQSQAHSAAEGTQTQADGKQLIGGQSADHGLIDDQPDLPECLDVPMAMSSRSAHWRTPSPPLAKDLTPPVLDGLQRPPRGLPAFA